MSNVSPTWPSASRALACAPARTASRDDGLHPRMEWGMVALDSRTDPLLGNMWEAPAGRVPTR